MSDLTFQELVARGVPILHEDQRPEWAPRCATHRDTRMINWPDPVGDPTWFCPECPGCAGCGESDPRNA